MLSRLLGRLIGLPPARHNRVGVQRDISVPMPDGAVLKADRWYPDHPGGAQAPIILLRSPYGRTLPIGRLGAERGYQVLMISCRGTFGSTGEWAPFRYEQADGQAVLKWLPDQPWFSGRVGTIGPSYLGYTQWAVADSPPPWLRAIAPAITTTNISRVPYPQPGVFALASTLTWLHTTEFQESAAPRRLLSVLRTGKQVTENATTTALPDLDQKATGHQVSWWQNWLAHDTPNDPWWQQVDQSAALTTAPPASLVAGWYDLFLPHQLADYRALKRAGRQARLTVGPWTHTNARGMAAMLRDSFDWMDTHLLGHAPTRPDADVRIFVMGAQRWLDLPDWPPQSTASRWHLQPAGELAPELPPECAPDRYRYDPGDATPSTGGASLAFVDSGPKDNREIEARPDVLTYTTAELTEHLSVIGEPTAELSVRSSLPHTDFFVRLCDVAPDGRSTNLSDGIVRLRPEQVEPRPDGSVLVRISLSPTANTFLPGHRIRLQVSSGAHPLFARNLGTGEPLATARNPRTAEQEVLHDPEHPCWFELPVVEAIRP